MISPLDIAVCGAGPAGLSAALALHRLGHRVTVFEQFEKAQPLGSGLILQPTGLTVLDWLGLGDRIRSLGARIDRLYGTASGSGRIVLDVRYEALGEARGCAVHRAALFNVLHDGVAAAGVSIRTASVVDGLDGRHVVLERGRREGPFDLVIDALGSRSPLIPLASAPESRSPLDYGAIWTNTPWPGAPFDPHALEQRYHGASVMIGVLPIGRQIEGGDAQASFFWSLKHRDFGQWRAAGLERWKAGVLRHWPEVSGLLSTVRDPAEMILATYHHHTLPLPYGPNLVFVGDSAHSTSPQLGQGANMALLDVRALAEAIRQGSNLQSAVEAYAKRRRFHVRLFQAMSRVFTPFYQSDSAVLPLVRDQVVAGLSCLPPAQRLLARLVSGHLGLGREG